MQGTGFASTQTDLTNAGIKLLVVHANNVLSFSLRARRSHPGCRMNGAEGLFPKRCNQFWTSLQTNPMWVLFCTLQICISFIG